MILSKAGEQITQEKRHHIPLPRGTVHGLTQMTNENNLPGSETCIFLPVEVECPASSDHLTGSAAWLQKEIYKVAIRIT